MLFLLLSITSFLIIHVSLMALAGHLLGVSIKRIVYGTGYRLIRWRHFEIRLLPISGYVQFFDSRDTDFEPAQTEYVVFDKQALWKRLMIISSGCLSILLFVILLMGSDGYRSWLQGMFQIVHGSVLPFSAAQDYLAQSHQLLSENKLSIVLPLVWSKFLAINTLPLMMLNGGQIIYEVARGKQQEPRWMMPCAHASAILLLLMAISWGVSLIVYTT